MRFSSGEIHDDDDDEYNPDENYDISQHLQSPAPSRSVNTDTSSLVTTTPQPGSMSQNELKDSRKRQIRLDRKVVLAEIIGRPKFDLGITGSNGELLLFRAPVSASLPGLA